MKKYILVFLAAALLLGSLSCLPLSAETESDGEFTYVIKDGNAAILQYTGNRRVVTVPSALGGAPVTEISGGAFRDALDLTVLHLPEGLSTIGNYAFFNCQRLISVSLPESLKHIGSNAFGWCIDLESITIPKNVESIGEGAFTACSSLASLTVAGGNRFYEVRQNCLIETESGLLLRGVVTEDIHIPEGVTVIGDGAFSGCTGLQKITIPKGVTRIGADAFTYCDGLTDVVIPDSVESIGDWAFSGCTELRTIYLPASVTTSGNFLFAGSKKLAHIYCEAEELPDGWSYVWLGDCKAAVHWGYTPSLGDIDGNGVIGATDYLLLKRHVLGSLTLTETQKIAADVNGDNEISALDYMLVKRHVLGSFVIGSEE